MNFEQIYEAFMLILWLLLSMSLRASCRSSGYVFFCIDKMPSVSSVFTRSDCYQSTHCFFF